MGFRNRILIVAMALLCALVLPLAVSAQVQITDASTNGGTDRSSGFPKADLDASRVVFVSDADLLSEGRADNDYEIWLWDEVTGLQRLTDTLANGGTDRDFWDCAISADGTRVAFSGDGDLLSEGRADTDEEIWLWDETLGLQRLTDVTMGGCVLCDAAEPEISDDGVLISFHSDADFLGAGNPAGVREIWVYDHATANLTQVTTASTGDRDSEDADISGDGAYIAFMSDSDFLAAGNLVNNDEIWLFADPVPVELVTFTVD